MADKDPIKQRYSFTSKGSEEDSRVLWTATNDYMGHEENLAETEQVAAINQNGKILATAQNSSLNTWKRVDAGLTMGTKPGMGMNPQRILENLQNLKAGDNVFWFDIENLGTHRGNAPDNLDWYMPTEIAVAHRKVSDKFMMVQGERGQISMLIKPTKEAEVRIANLIGKAEMMMKQKNWQGLSKDERRTLNDLILYGSEDPFGKKGGNAIFESRNGITQVINQNRLAQAPNNFIFQASHLKAMRRGLNNLMNHGNSSEAVASQMLNMFGGMDGNFKLGGFNIQNFDIPMLVDYLNGMVAPGVKSQSQSSKVGRLASQIGSARDIDTRQAINVLHKDLASRFGTRLTQSDIAQALGLDVKNAHMGIADIALNIDIHNKLVEQHGMMSMVNGKTNGLTAMWDDTVLKKGDALFSVGGLAGNQAGKFDAVYTKTNEGFQALYDKKMNPLFKNTLYSLHQEYSDLELGDGKKYFGMMLKNEDTGNYHFLARETKEELQNIVHQNLYSVDHVNTSRLTGSGDIAQDQARRKYLKMYSNEDGGGRKLMNKMYSALGALDEARELVKQGKLESSKVGEYVANASGVATQFKDKVTGKSMKYAATPEFMRDFLNLENRLREEKPYVQEFLSNLDQFIDPKKHQTSQNIALDHFRRLMDQKFGRNEVVKEMGNILPVTLNHKRHAITGKVIEHDVFNIDLSSKSSIQRGINSAMWAGATNGKPTVREKKERLKRIINSARQRGPSGLIETERRMLLKMVDDWDGRSSEYVIVNEITNRIDRQYNHNQGMGKNRIALEDVSGLRPNRRQALSDNWDATKSSIINEAITRAKVYETSGWLKGSGLNVQKGSMLDQFVSTHNKAMKNLQNTAFSGSNIEAIDARKTLERLINSASKDGFQAALVYDGKEKAIKIALAHEDIAKNVFKMAPNKILEDHRVATVPLAFMNERQMINVGGQQKLAYSKIFTDMEGKAHLGTAFEQSVSQVAMRMNRARQMMKEGKVLEAESMLRSAHRTALDNYSANNRYMSDEVEMVERKSAGARFARAQYIDVVNFAAEWYEEVGGNKTVEQIKRRMERENLSFFNAMDAATQRQFLSGVQPWARNKYGLNINMHSIKDTKAMNAVYSTEAGDVRHLIPFAHMNPTARENMPKAVNYVPLDAQNSTQYLKSKGVSDAKIQRMMNRGLITETAERFLVGEDGTRETNWLNLRTAYVAQKDLGDIINAKGGNNRMSTYDGMFLIAEDVASAFTFTRTRNIKLDPGEAPDEKIKDFFNKAVKDGMAEIDGDGNIMMKKEFQQVKTLSDLGLDVDPTTGKYTVGKMTKHLTTHGTVYLQGWNQNKGSVQVGEVELINTGTKMGTDSGDRITATIVKRQQLKDWGFGDVDAILPEQEMGKSMHGSFIKSQVALVIDQAQQMIMESDKVTVGGVNKVRALENAVASIHGMMNRHLGTAATTRLNENTQLVMNTHKFLQNNPRLTLDNMQAFMSEADSYLTNLAADTGQTHVANLSQKYRRGVEGFSRSDVYEWHNSIGMTEGSREGLVRYGYKEIDAYSRRADAVLGRNNAVTGWLREHIKNASEAQHQDVKSFYKKGVLRSVLDVTDESILSGRINAGEVVIRTSGDAFSFNDREGVKAVRMSGGVAEVSMHAFNDLPQRNKRGQVFTAGDYAKTVLDMEPVMNQIVQDVDGNTVNVGDIFRNNGGTALFELPDETFSRKYVRFIDDKLFNIGTDEEGMGVLKELQKDKLSIFRNTKEYQANTNDETRAKLQQSIDNYESTLARVVTSARSGSIQDMRSARLDMSGRFNIQGVNPFVNKGYEEGTVYVGRERARQMIAGAEELIAGAVGLDVNGLDSATRNKKVLDYIASDGLYSFVNRYPTIAEDTGQILKFKIDDALDTEAKQMGFDHFKGGYFTVGTAVTMNADFDGDFFSAVLAHYKSVKGVDGATIDASAVHSEMKQVFKHDQAKLIKAASEVTAKLEKEANSRNLTVGELWKDEAFRDQFKQGMNLKVGRVYDKETEIARMGKANVGPLSNMGQTLFSMARTSFNTLADAGRISGDQARNYIDVIDQFGRAAEQKAISSKKFTVAALREQIEGDTPGLNKFEMDDEIMRRMDIQQQGVELLRKGMARPDAAGIQMIRDANDILGFIDGKSRYDLDTSLDALGTLHRIEGGGRAFQNRYQRVWGMSEGDGDIERISRGLRGEMGEQGTFSRTAEFMADYSDTFASAKDTLEARHTRNILSNWDRLNGDTSTLSRLIDSADVKMTDHVLEGSMVADRAASSLSQMAGKFMPSLDGIGGAKGVATGAVAFGAMWAASALMRSGPTPEQTEAVAPPPPPNAMPQPTARVVEGASGGEHINIRINAKDANGMSQDQISALVQQEISAMTSMPMNMNMNVNDNTQNINQQWLQGIVANAIGKGYGL